MTRKLTIDELMDDTYSELCNRHSPKKFSFPEPIRVEIARDPDYHRGDDVSYMEYCEFSLFRFGDLWAVGRGKQRLGYSGRNYRGDIMALQIKNSSKKSSEKKIKEEISEKSKFSTYFTNSLFYVRGQSLMVLSPCRSIFDSSIFERRMFELVRPEIENFVEGPKDESGYLSLSPKDGIAEYKEDINYKPGFVGFLADAIEATLYSKWVDSKRDKFQLLMKENGYEVLKYIPDRFRQVVL